MTHVLIARLKAPTPAFWRKLRSRCLVAAGTLGGATATLAVLPQENPAVKLLTYGTAALTLMLTGAATVASLACDSDPSTEPYNTPSTPV
jgi:hypothetical protein